MLLSLLAVDGVPGMSDYLIARRGWRARPLAHLIGLVDGCGGKADVSGRA
jgi:hypothetical protein